MNETIGLKIAKKIYDKLLKDMKQFGIKNINNFCNRILEYCLEENSDLDDVDKIKKMLDNHLKKDCKAGCKDDILSIIQRALNPSIELEQKHEKINLRLNKVVIEKLEHHESAVGSDYVRNYFLRRIFEKFCNQPRYKREKIIFHKNFKKIMVAVDEKKTLKLQINGPKDMVIDTECFPVGMFSSKEETCFYLIGVDKKENRIYPTSLSSIKKVEYKPTYKIVDDECMESEKYENKVAKSKIEEAEKRIENKDNTVGVYTHIVGYLTEKGQEEYSRIPTNRPGLEFEKVEECGEYRYRFEYYGTEFSISRYFIRFGKECKIVEPQDLREKFINFYKEAVESYK